MNSPTVPFDPTIKAPDTASGSVGHQDPIKVQHRPERVTAAHTKAFRKAYRRWKLANKKGPALIVTRRTLKGKPVY